MDIDAEIEKLLAEFPGSNDPEPDPEPAAPEPASAAPADPADALDAEIEAALAAALSLPGELVALPPEESPEADEEAEEEEPEPVTWRVTVGADLRCYAQFDVEAITLDEARQAALKLVESESINAGNWKAESLQGEISILAEPADDFDSDAEFWDAPAPVGSPRYSDLEAFARRLYSGSVPLESARSEAAALFGAVAWMDPPQPPQEAEAIAVAPAVTGAPSSPVPAAAGVLASTLAVLAVSQEESDEQRALAQIRQARAAFLSMYCALKAFEKDFGDVIENDEDMPGADTVDRVVNLWDGIKGAIAMAEGRA